MILEIGASENEPHDLLNEPHDLLIEPHDFSIEPHDFLMVAHAPSIVAPGPSTVTLRWFARRVSERSERGPIHPASAWDKPLHYEQGYQLQTERWVRQMSSGMVYSSAFL